MPVRSPAAARTLLLCLCAQACGQAADSPAPPSPPAPLSAAAVAGPNGGDVALLPPTLPGYELRVLDRRKTLLFDAGGARYEVRLPIFLYYPDPGRRRALALLRQVADDLRRAAHEPDRNEADLDGLVARLDSALELLAPSR